MFEEKIPSGYRFNESSIRTLNDLQASVGIEQLKRLDSVNLRRINNASVFCAALSNLQGIGMQKAISNAKHTYLYFYVQTENIIKKRKQLILQGIDSRKDGLCLCTGLEMFKHENKLFPVAEQLAKRNIILPNITYISKKRVNHIAIKLKKGLGRQLA
jgi:dTDP-4-amino-4,6-dideoxygalactose transaminase